MLCFLYNIFLPIVFLLSVIISLPFCAHLSAHHGLVHFRLDGLIGNGDVDGHLGCRLSQHDRLADYICAGGFLAFLLSNKVEEGISV